MKVPGARPRGPWHQQTFPQAAVLQFFLATDVCFSGDGRFSGL